MAEFLGVNDSLESCTKNKNKINRKKNKTKAEISRLSPDYFRG